MSTTKEVTNKLVNMQAQEHVDTITKSRRVAILPTKEILLSNAASIICPVNGCGKVIKRCTALKGHLAHHPLDQVGDFNSYTVLLNYHCPVQECIYNKFSERFFSNIKYLKQHYQKVHAIKYLKCPKCRVAFSQKSFLDAHLRQCGHSFQCMCGVEYSSREAYLTHARRNHPEISVTSLMEQGTAKPQDTATADENLKVTPLRKVLCPIFTTAKETVVKPRLLLPKPAPINSVPLPTLAAIALSELSVMRESCLKIDGSTQTDNECGSKLHCLCCREACTSGKVKRGANHYRIGSGVKRSSTVDLGSCRQLLSDNAYSSKRLRRSAETQTKGISNGGRHSKRQKACAETQTLGHLILEKAMAEANLPVAGQISSKQTNLLRCQSIETQTADILATRTGNSFQTTHSSRECATVLRHAEPVLNNEYSSQRIASCETQTIWNTLESDVAGDATAQNMSPLHCDTIPNSQSYADLERSSTSTQTTNAGVLSVGMRQCSSSQTEKDVFLGHMGNSFSCNQAFSPSLPTSTLNSVFSPSGCMPLNQVSNQTETCGIQYADLFPHGSSKLGENRVLSSETQTELNFDMLLNCDGDDEQSNDSILCSNIQTQTTDDLESLSYELLTNMHTQTNEDFLFPELTFSDIQTQTSWKDTVSANSSHSVSVHIQTQMPESSTQVINMQTQTFVSPLEIGIEFADSHTQTTWSFMQDLISDL